MVVLPAPEGPTRATIWPGSGGEGDVAQHLAGRARCRDGHRLQRGQRHLVGGGVAELDVVELDGAGPSAAAARRPGCSATMGLRSSTSKTRSKLTSAVITSTCTLDSAVSGP